MKAQIACDGSSLSNPGPSGWGVVITWPDGKKSEYSGGEAHSTNQRMELTAAIEAVSRIPLGMEATIFSDSTYVVSGICEWIGNWKRKGWRTPSGPVANQDLWQKLDLLAQKRLGALTWQWVKGHSGHPENERANELAQTAAQSAKEGLIYQEEAEPVDWEEIKKGATLPIDRHPVTTEAKSGPRISTLHLREISHDRQDLNPRANSRNSEISADKRYLCRIFGGWYLGRFHREWYGWNFSGWINPAGIQLDSIEAVYEVQGIDDLSVVDWVKPKEEAENTDEG